MPLYVVLYQPRVHVTLLQMPHLYLFPFKAAGCFCKRVIESVSLIIRVATGVEGLLIAMTKELCQVR